jgi:hypothetical protein
MSATVVVEEL